MNQQPLKNISEEFENSSKISKSKYIFVYFAPPYCAAKGNAISYALAALKWVARNPPPPPHTHTHNAPIKGYQDLCILLPDYYRAFFESNERRAEWEWLIGKSAQRQFEYSVNEKDRKNDVPFMYYSVTQKKPLQNRHRLFTEYIRNVDFDLSEVEVFLNEIRKSGKDIVITTFLNSVSLKKLAQKIGAQIIFNELGPLRRPYYQMTAFFDFSGVNADTSSEKEWKLLINDTQRKQEFVDWCKKNEITKKSLRHLLSPSIKKENFHADTDTKIGVALQVEDDSNTLVYSKGWNTISLIASLDEDNYRLRLHPLGHAVYRGKIDLSPSSLHFIARCETILTINSSVGIEAIFWDKPTRFLGENPATFLQEVPQEEQEIAWIYFFLVYLIPWKFLCDTDYYTWRLAKPSLHAIAECHLTHYKQLLPSSVNVDVRFKKNEEISEKRWCPLTDYLKERTTFFNCLKKYLRERTKVLGIIRFLRRISRRK